MHCCGTATVMATATMAIAMVAAAV